MNSTPWILLDTETNGITQPIYVVEIGAQKMQGWQPDGPPFQRLLNQNAHISPEASRVNGYTREILERDGDDPLEVYRSFAAYAGNLPTVAYNLRYDWDDVLCPEWQRLGLAPIGQRGLCALELARRLLDPVPAGNCKLQTLRQFYRLPERGAHTALGDVETVVDLMDQVLRPLAHARGLFTWADLVAFTESLWFPSQISFGKYKGRRFQEAATDQALLGWLNWLAGSSNARSASMGRWYLAQLESGGGQTNAPIGVAATCDGSAPSSTASGSVVVFLSPEKAELQQLITAARNRLAELEADYTEEKHAVDVTMAKLFRALKPHYQRRDRLKLKIDHSRQYIEVLMQSGDEEAEQVNQAHEEARQQSDADYAQADADAATKEALTEEQSKEMKAIWRKLVKAFHPDRCVDDPVKREAHEWLTAEINRARDQGDVQLLREIADNPDRFLLKHGMAPLSQDESVDVMRLRSLFDSLQQRILETLEAQSNLRESTGYVLHQRTEVDTRFFDDAVSDHIQALETEISAMEIEAKELDEEIEGLQG
jgi:DNA polymerase-3 subunit epsilon